MIKASDVNREILKELRKNAPSKAEIEKEKKLAEQAEQKIRETCKLLVQKMDKEFDAKLKEIIKKNGKHEIWLYGFESEEQRYRHICSPEVDEYIYKLKENGYYVKRICNKEESSDPDFFGWVTTNAWLYIVW